MLPINLLAPVSLLPITEVAPLEKQLTMLRNLNSAFGGELWVGGVLCYKDGGHIANPPLFEAKEGSEAA